MSRPNWLRFPVWHIRFAAHVRCLIQLLLAGLILAVCCFWVIKTVSVGIDMYMELQTAKQDNAQAMAMLSGKYYTDGKDTYRLEEVKLREVVGGL